MSDAAVVVTNHNYGRFVADAVDSALAQTRPVDVVVVDDGSTDDSLSVLAGYEARVTLVAQANGGQASAFNAGFAATTAPVVFFLDGDDRLHPDAVEEVLAALAARPDAVRVQFGLDFIDTAGRRRPGGLPEADRRLPEGDLRSRLVTNPDDIAWQPTSGNAFRASVLRELLPMPTEAYRISADHYLSNLSALHGPVLAIDRGLASYRIHGDNADHRDGFDMDRGRDILRRTQVTHHHLIERGRAMGLAMPESPDGFRSLSQAALRLASVRTGPTAQHPIEGDGRWPALRAGLAAAGARADMSAPRRMAAAAWIMALALVPRPVVPRVAALGLTR
ncbi:MAG: glycosyltransferase [Actinomycetota bacterium]